MSSQKFEITNPEAIKLINDIKSGQAYKPLKDLLKKYRWYIISFLVLFSVFLSIIVGKFFSSMRGPSFTPPPISELSQTPTPITKSKFDSLKKSLVEYSTTMPDPALPPIDNKISLEAELPE